MTKPKKVRGTPKRRATKPAVRPGTALAKAERRLELATGRKQARGRIELLPALEDGERTITDDIMLGGLGLVELKLTPAEEAVLAEPVPIAEVLLKPHTAYPPAYLSHPTYTRWFNRAFGRLGWSLVPASKPLKASGAVVCAYLLHIHGKPVALAWGEQEFHENNKYQSYGDALEATVASALRRCAKHLGVGLELWDKGWQEDFRRANPEMVKRAVMAARDDRGSKPASSSSSSSSSSAPRPAAPATPPPAAYSNPAAAEKITQKQRQRLFQLSRNSGRSDEEIKGWLKRRYRVETTDEITRGDYDAICQAIESSADLPEPGR